MQTQPPLTFFTAPVLSLATVQRSGICPSADPGRGFPDCSRALPSRGRAPRADRAPLSPQNRQTERNTSRAGIRHQPLSGSVGAAEKKQSSDHY